MDNLEHKPDSRTINVMQVTPFDYEFILSKFADSFEEKLRMYTGQELFYAYKLATFKPRNPKAITGGEVFMLAMKAKLMRWLRGQDKQPIYPTAWEKIGKRWSNSFEDFVETVA